MAVLLSANAGNPGNPINNFNHLLQQIKKFIKESDTYLASHKDPLQTTWLKYIANANIVGISASSILPFPIRWTTYLISGGHVSMSTYYQHRRMDAYPAMYKNKKNELINYGATNAVKDLIIYPAIAYGIRGIPNNKFIAFPLAISTIGLLDYILPKN